MIRPISTAIPAVLFLATWASAQETPLLPYGALTAPSIPINKVVAPRTVTLILNALQSDTDVARRARLVADLGLCDTPESIAQLNTLLADPSPLIRAAAVRSLSALKKGDDAAFRKLVADASPAVRGALVQAKFADSVLAGINDSDPSVRTVAVSYSINEATDRALAERLPSMDPPLQALACRALAARKAASATEAIARLLESGDIVTRVAAIEALTSIGTLTRPQIETQLAHPHPAVRVAATAGAMVLANDDRLAIANKSILDKDLAVRTPAAQLMATLASEPTVAPLFSQLGAGYQPLRLASRDALIAIAEANTSASVQVRASSALLLRDNAVDRRLDGSFILGRLKAKDGFDDHVKLLDDADWVLVKQVAISLGQIGDPSVGDKLLTTLTRAMPGEEATPEGIDAAEQTILACVAIRHRPVIEATRRMYTNKKSAAYPRAAAIYAMGVMGTPEEADKALRPVLNGVTDPEEASVAIIEGIKGLGNAKAKTASGALEKIVKGTSGLEYQYTAHVSLGRINGTNTPFEQQPVDQTAETSIQAVTPAAN